MALLWRGLPMSVRDVKKGLGDAKAHTTVMTTLDRLYKKGLLSREREGTAYIYSAALSREDYQRSLVEKTVGKMLESSAGPVLAAFVDAAAEVAIPPTFGRVTDFSGGRAAAAVLEEKRFTW